MRKNILVIGSTRQFGKLLVQRLLAAGHTVTIATRGRTSDPFGARVERILVDRHHLSAMLNAFAKIDSYDVVYDQLCDSPMDAAIAVRVFAGKVKRYVMASTMDVYRELLGVQSTPFAETDLNVMAQPIDTAFPWDDPVRSAASQASGKRQAEAYLYRDGSLPVVTVRIGHVVAGPEDASARLGHYVDLVREHTPLRYASTTGATSLLSARALCSFMVWVGAQDFLGPINAACDGPLSARALYQRVGAVLDAGVKAISVAGASQPCTLSPFDYAHPYVMNTSRAAELGYQFSHTDDWLDDLIRLHDLTFA